jgi:MerR family redox-sensitive transcriptional activator SoxR
MGSSSLVNIKVKVNLKSSLKCGLVFRMEDLITIGETARRSGVAASALRFYEERGLIRSRRAGSGHRRYPRAVLRRIAFIVFAQRIGLNLVEIGGELAKLPADHTPTGRDWSRLSSKWQAKVEERIAELARLKDGLAACIGCGCLSLDRCQYANPGDRAGRRGSGPRYWIGDRPVEAVKDAPATPSDSSGHPASIAARSRSSRGRRPRRQCGDGD